MADETKKYIIDVQDNLDVYAQHVIDADKAVQEFTEENARLLTSQDKNSKEYVTAAAKLKTLQTELKNSKKNMETATQANVAQKGSYDELYQTWKLAQTQLKLMGDAYTTNEKGVRVLSQRYIEQSKVVASTKKSLDEFGKGVNDNRLNVGNYSSALQGATGAFQALPGPIGSAISGIQRLTTAAKAFIATPIGLVLAGIATVLGLLFKGFTNSQGAMDKFNRTLDALSAGLSVVYDRLSNAVDALLSFKKGTDEAEKGTSGFTKAILGLARMSPVFTLLAKGLKDSGIAEEINKETQEASALTLSMQKLQDQEIEYTTVKAQLRKEIEENRLAAKDENATFKERLASLDTAIEKEKEIAEVEVKFAVERARISQERVDQGNSTRAELQANADLQANVIEVQTASLQKQRTLASERLSFINKINTEEKAAYDKELNFTKQYNKDISDAYAKRLDEDLDLMIKDIDKEIAAEILKNEKLDAYEENRILTNLQNERELRQLAAKNDLELRHIQLEQEREQEIQAAQETGASIYLIEKKYAAMAVQLEMQMQAQKLGVLNDFTGAVGTLFKKNTIAYKLAATVQTLISTYAGAQKAFEANAGIPPSPLFGILAAASATAIGLANVRAIAGIGENSTSGSAPTAISSSSTAQRTFASPVTPSIVNTPQLTQPQLNALPNAMLTAEDIAQAVSKLPNPIVAVETIENVSRAKQAVEVRATI